VSCRALRGARSSSFLDGDVHFHFAEDEKEGVKKGGGKNDVKVRKNVECCSEIAWPPVLEKNFLQFFADEVRPSITKVCQNREKGKHRKRRWALEKGGLHAPVGILDASIAQDRRPGQCPNPREALHSNMMSGES